VAEDGADADASTAHANAGDTCANHLCGLRVHEGLLLCFVWMSSGLNDPGE
jgi:hypothetical protein